MVNEANPSCRKSGMITITSLAALAILGMTTFSYSNSNSSNTDTTTSTTTNRELTTFGIFTEEEAIENSKEIKAWRNTIRTTCEKAPNREEMSTVKTIAMDGFKRSYIRSGTQEYNLPMESCSYVFMDFGSNIGDSSARLIDAGLLGCSHFEDHVIKRPHFDVKEGKVMEDPNPSPLVRWLRERIREFDSGLGPEDYCVYGVEGNPIFTEGLRDLERDVMRTQPRPVRRLHFLTETVGAEKDGPTTLYLDTINKEQNFWGSSILSGHIDVQRSATFEGGLVEASVTGITLSTLMKQTLSYFTSDNNNPTKKREHLILKIDIEGGEFLLLNEAYESGVLCEFAEAGNRVDMIVEYHTSHFIGEYENVDVKFYQEVVRNRFTECGVHLHEMGMKWG